MTTLLAVAGGSSALDAARFERLLCRSGKETRVHLVHVAPGAIVGVATSEADSPPGDHVAVHARYTVAATGTLYYLDDLSRHLELAGIEPPRGGTSAAAWIARALSAWGVDAPEHIEGDFAFIAWDAVDQLLVGARDHAGGHPLFVASRGSGVAVGSSLRTLHVVPGVASGINLAAVAEDASNGDLADPRETAFDAIERVPAGHRLTWRDEGRPRIERWYHPPQFERDTHATPFEEAAEELRGLLARAVRERVDGERRTAVTLSGGYDSTAIFGAGNYALEREGSAMRLAAVSVSHPPGDPGREDEWITATASRWGVTPSWVDSERVPLIGDIDRRAAMRDEPLVHPYELWNEALADACRGAGARVALYGVGGDAWFSGTSFFLADLLRRGQLLTLRREWREHAGGGGLYKFFKLAVQPNLPSAALQLMTRLRGGRRFTPVSYRELPGWLRRDFVAAHGMEERRNPPLVRRPGESYFAAEHTWYQRGAFPERVHALLTAINASRGVEMRSPLVDRRVIEFASHRPRWESVSRGANKHLLRSAVQGLVPANVLAPRPQRTGLPVRYLERSADAYLPVLEESITAGMLLAQFGMVDPMRLLDQVKRYTSSESGGLDELVSLIYLVHTERWLRSVLG